MNTAHENWNSGAAYERWVGRWSRVVTRDFLDRLPVPAGVSWADVGCGTGALSEAILSQCAPREVRACDRAAGYVEHAAARSADPRVR